MPPSALLALSALRVFWHRYGRALDYAAGAAVLVGLVLLVHYTPFDWLENLTYGRAAWIWVALTGLRYTAQNLWDALGDQAYFRRRHLNGGRELVAQGNVRREQVRLVQNGALAVLGVYASLPAAWRTPMGWVAPLLLVIVSVGITLNSFLETQGRRAVLAWLNKAPGTPGTPGAPGRQEAAR